MKRPRTILIVDDEEKIVGALQVYLKKEGCQVLCVYDGTMTIKLFKENEVSLILLDLMLPDIMGEQVCKSIRTVSHVPIVILTARTEEADLINEFQIEADGYIFKSSSPRVVVTKVGAILKRAEGDELTSLSVSYNQGKLVIDFDNMIVKVQGKETDLTPTELKILTTVAKAPNRILTREQLITCALNDDFDGYGRGIDTYIKGIQSKIKNNRRYPSYILIIHGLDYKFAGEMERKEVRRTS